MDRIEFIGNLTKDPELRTTQSGIYVCSFSVAVNKPLTKAQREAGQQPSAKYYRVSAWRELGENCAKYLAKGRKVYVEGTVDVSTYTGNDGMMRASLEVNANQVEFLTPRGVQDGQPSSGQGNYSPAPSAAYTPPQMAYTAPSEFADTADPNLPSGFTAVEQDADLPF